MRFPCAFPLPLGIFRCWGGCLVQMEKPITVFHCQKVIWGKKVRYRETVGDWEGRFSPQANSHHVWSLRPECSRLIWSKIKITGLEGEKESICCISHSFLSFLDALRGMHDMLQGYIVCWWQLSLDIRVFTGSSWCWISKFPHFYIYSKLSLLLFKVHL